MRACVLLIAVGWSGMAAAAPSIDAKDSSGWTALQRAARAGDLTEIAALIAKGASLEASSPQVYDGATAVEIALQFSAPPAAKLLLDRGASIAGPIGPKVVALAAREGADDVIDVLLKRGVKVAGSDALSLAAKYNHASSIIKLVKAGADVNAPDVNDHHFTPLMAACQDNQLEAAKALLDAGARVNEQDDEKSTALHWAVFAARPIEIHMYRDLSQPHDTIYRPQPKAPLVKLLIDRGAKIEIVDDHRNTALHHAALMNARSAAEVLVKAGANRAAKNADGKTPLALAKDRNNSVVEVLGPPRARRP